MPTDEPSQHRGLLPELSNLLIDRNRDGYPDDIVGMLAIPEDLDTVTWEAVLNLSARLGLGTSGFTPPIIAREPMLGRISVTVRNGDADRLNAMVMKPQDPTHSTVSPPETGQTPPSIDLRNPWSIDGFLTDRDGDQAADDASIHLLLPDEVAFLLGTALANLAARIGVECGALTLPIAGGPTPPGRTALRIELSEQRLARLTNEADGSLCLAGQEDALAHAIDRLASLSSGFLADVPAHRATEWLRRSAAGWTAEGQLAQFRASLQNTKPDRIVILETDRHLDGQLRDILQRIHPDIVPDPPSPRETVVFDHQWTAEWEVNRLFQALEEEILPALDPASPVDFIAMISEPPAIRRRVRGQISRRMLDLGFSEGSLHVLDAFKSGLGWLQEIIVPEFRSLGSIDSVEIQARTWDPEQHDGQLDMPIRWLQELFPGDEILAGELNLPLDRININLSSELSSIYRVIARNDAGQPLLERTFSPLWRRIDYLAGIPGAGNVTVTTGGIIATQPGKAHRERVLTDPEVFWRYMQVELLPNLRRFILTTTGGEPEPDDQPFFDDLFVDLRISASDHPYGIRQERHSAAEALHEDIYFSVLDFVEELGKITTGQKLGAPGSVRPFVTVAPGRQPDARIRLTRRPPGIARIVTGRKSQTVLPATKTLPDPFEVAALSFAPDQILVEIADASGLQAMGPFLRALADEYPAASASTVLRLRDSSGLISIGVPDPASSPVPDTVCDGPIPSGRILSNREIFPHLKRLAEHPAVSLVPAAEISWQGRPIPAVAVTSPQEARIWSMRKLSHFKPTKLIVARHHANEVASTTSALQMIEALTRDETGQAVLRGLNLIFLPLENPDGAALHDLLRRVNPTWKHHPARYNATGYEFGEDQGNPDSRYGEGRVRDLVWHACLPDVVVDNHGVPSHEWTQLFAGFGSPPRFGVSYWQVQALLYGILPYLDDPVHHAACEAVRDRVASEIAEDPDLLHWNRVFTERYRTWGHQWLPDRFPMALHKEMLFHSNPVDPESDRGRRSYAVRYPRTTILSWVTEVCDETVEGVELERTARAHLLANKAVMELLHDHRPAPEIHTRETETGIHVRTGRERPLRIQGGRSI